MASCNFLQPGDSQHWLSGRPGLGIVRALCKAAAVSADRNVLVLFVYWKPMGRQDLLTILLIFFGKSVSRRV